MQKDAKNVLLVTIRPWFSTKRANVNFLGRKSFDRDEVVLVLAVLEMHCIAHRVKWHWGSCSVEAFCIVLNREYNRTVKSLTLDQLEWNWSNLMLKGDFWFLGLDFEFYDCGDFGAVVWSTIAEFGCQLVLEMWKAKVFGSFGTVRDSCGMEKVISIQLVMALLFSIWKDCLKKKQFLPQCTELIILEQYVCYIELTAWSLASCFMDWESVNKSISIFC